MEKKKWQAKNFWHSFKFASTGLICTLKRERNILIQLFFAVMAVILGLILKISKIEWAIIIFTIMFVIFAEMMNTAVENTVDLFTEEYNEKAKVAKDVAAGAVLISAINAICMGLIIYLDKIVQILF